MKVEFLSFVPVPAREFINHEVEVVQHRLSNAENLTTAEKMLDDADKNDVRERIKCELRRDLEILNLYATDERMREVYALLSRLFTDDRRWWCFLRAGIEARDNFGEDRSELKDIVNLQEELVAAAARLRVILEDLASHAFADEGIPQNRRFNFPEGLFIMGMRSTLGPDGEFRLRHWESVNRATSRAFELRPIEIVSEIERQAADWKPRFGDDPAALALATQKNTPRYQFIRSFWYELSSFQHVRQVKHWEKWTALLKAMAIVATIIRDDTVEVVYANVKDALKDF